MVQTHLGAFSVRARHLKGLRAVILERQNERVRRHAERVVARRQHHVAKRDLGGQRVAVIDDWFAVRAVPAVELDAAAAVRVRANVSVDRRRRFEL